MPKQENKTENALVIKNVILTEQALHTIEKLQESSNECIKEYVELLGDAVCYLAKTRYHFGGSYEVESMVLIEKLSYIREDLKDLKKP